MILLSLILGIIPLLGIVWTITSDSLNTVGGLFTTLILLSLSGILFLNVFLDLRKRRQSRKVQLQKAK